MLVDDFIVITIKNKRKRPKQLLTVFLHEDCLVLTKQELKDTIHPPVYHFQDQLLCSEMTLTENYKAKDSKLKFALSSGPIATAETVHVLQPAYAEGAQELKDKWTGSISDLLMRQLETVKGVHVVVYVDLKSSRVNVNLASQPLFVTAVVQSLCDCAIAVTWRVGLACETR